MSKPQKHLLLSILLIALGLAGFLIGPYLWPESNFSASLLTGSIGDALRLRRAATIPGRMTFQDDAD